MILFLDTSVLVKLYHNEDGSDRIEKIIKGGVSAIALSELSILEFRSALLKKCRTGELDVSAAKGSIQCFQNDYLNFMWVHIDQELIDSAALLLMKYGDRGLRTLDSIQLACALKLDKVETEYATADELLKNFFVNEGLTVAY